MTSSQEESVLSEALTAVAAMAGAGVVQAAGTDTWASVRQRVQGWFGRDDDDVRRRLDDTQAAQGRDDEAELGRLQAAWVRAFAVRLGALDGPEQQAAARGLEPLAPTGQAATGPGAVQVQGNVTVTAESGSVAAQRIDTGGGSITVHSPPPPPGPSGS